MHSCFSTTMLAPPFALTRRQQRQRLWQQQQHSQFRRRDPIPRRGAYTGHVRDSSHVRLGLMRSGSRDFGQPGTAARAGVEAASRSPRATLFALWVDRFLFLTILCYCTLLSSPVRFIICGHVDPLSPLFRAEQQRDLGDLLLSFFRRYSPASKERISPTTVLRIKGLTVRDMGVRSMRPCAQKARSAADVCLFSCDGLFMDDSPPQALVAHAPRLFRVDAPRFCCTRVFFYYVASLCASRWDCPKSERGIP